MTAVAIPVCSETLAIQLQTARLATVTQHRGPLDLVPRVQPLIASHHVTERRDLRSGLSARLRPSRRPLRSHPPTLCLHGRRVAETQQRSGHRGVRFVRLLVGRLRCVLVAASGAGEGSCERSAGDGGESVARGVMFDGLLDAEAAALGEGCHRRLGIRTDGESVQLEGETGHSVGWGDGLGGWEEEGLCEGVGRNPFEEGMVFLLPTGEAFGLRNRLPHGCFSESEGGGEMLPFLGGGGFGVGPLAVSTVFSMGERMGE